MSDMKNVFLTGASGFVGQAVLSSLLARLSPEDNIYMLTRRTLDISDARVFEIRGDFAVLDSLYDVISKADYIIHVAGEARLRGTYDYVANNVEPTRKLLELATRAGVCQKFIFVSSIAAMDRAPHDRCDKPLSVASECLPRTAYGRSKLTAEQLVLQSGLPFTVFRPGFIFGPGMRNDSHLRLFARYIKRGLPLSRLGFPGRISLVHVNDMARAITGCLFAEIGRNRICLAVSHSLSMGKVMEIIGESLTGHKSRQISLQGFAPVVKRFHHLFPTAVASMFINYYLAEEDSFLEDFLDVAPLLLSQTVNQVVEGF